MAEEIWKDAIGYEEYFRISNFGNVFSKRTNKILITAKENSIHSISTGLQKPLRGMKHGSSKLTDDNVNYIRENYKPRCSVNGSRALGRKFGVDHVTFLSIVKNKNWKHLI
jgi:hypothetical protein